MTEDTKAILGGVAVLFALGMFFWEFMGVFSGLSMIASSAALLLAHLGVIPWEVMCWAGLAVVGGLALDWYRYSARVDRDIRVRNTYDRIQAIEQAWWDANPHPQMQLSKWLQEKHGLDQLDILYPAYSSYASEEVHWFSKVTGERIVVPMVYEHLTGPWTTIPKPEWIKKLRQWEDYKVQHEGDLDALQAYVEGRTR